MSELPTCAWLMGFCPDLTAPLFEGLAYEPAPGRPWVERARQQIAAGWRLAAEMPGSGYEPSDFVDVMHFLHPDGKGAFDQVGWRYESLLRTIALRLGRATPSGGAS